MLLGIRSTESAVAALLAGLLLWAPLPFGSVTPAGELFLRLAAFAALALAIAGRGRPPARLLPVAALAGVALLGLLQSCHWPAGVTAALSPEHARMYREVAALEEPAAAPTAIPLTLDASVSRSSALSWLAAAALLAAALVAGRRARHRRWLLAALVVAALGQLGLGLVGVAQDAPAGLAALLRPGGRLRGTFTNPNHLSLLFEMSMAPVAAWGWYELTRLRRAAGRRWLRPLTPLAIWLLLLASVALTGSRAGLVAAGVGLVVQLACMPMAGRRRAAWAPVAVFLVIVGVLAALGSRLEIARYDSATAFEDNLRSRLLAVPASLELWRRFPATGTGLGTFEDAFPAVAPTQLTTVIWNRAHNDPVELLVTGGLVGLGLGALALVGLLRPILRRTRLAERREDRAAGIAALGALAAAGFHELLDFGLVIPANHLLLLVILGAAAAGSAGRGDGLEGELDGAHRPADRVDHLDEVQAGRHVE